MLVAADQTTPSEAIAVIVPAVGHVLLRVVGITGGIQLPPHVRPGIVATSHA